MISSNSDGIWNKEPTVLRIFVSPPFWLSGWAYVLYAVIGIFLFLTYHRYSIKYARLRSKLSYESLIRQKENELHQSKLQFFTNISHEVKTPLTLILAPLDKLLHMFADNELVSSQLATMKANGDRLLRLINQLLDFRKLETGNAQLHLKTGDLVVLLKNTINYFKQLGDEKNVKIEFIHAIQSFQCSYDGDILEKVISNLLSNALKFTPQSGWINVFFDIKEEDNGKTAVIEVVNSDSLIREQDLERIFQPFQQGIDNQVEGTGIGLAYTRALLELVGISMPKAIGMMTAQQKLHLL